jgi:hypothetical protein
MSMGKGLEAILKAPDKLKPVDSAGGATEGLGNAQVSTVEDTIKARVTAEKATDEISTADMHIGEVAAKGKNIAEVTTEEVATTQVTTTQVTTGGVTIRQDVITKAISDAKRSPRISTWSPVAVGTLKSLWMTQPQFSMSDEIRTLIEEGLTKKYPELVEMVKKELEKSDATEKGID